MFKQMLKYKKKSGYAIVIVLVLIVVGTVALIMFNRESLFFSKVAGFFSRARKIQSQALDGIELAKGDLRKITNNSRDPNATGDKFMATSSGGPTGAYNQGLYFDHNNSGLTRTITPRFTRHDGDFTVNVYYFPENPCTTAAPCPTDEVYNKIMPKRFVIVSEAVNNANGEVFTAESRVQAKLENLSEISYGIAGVKCLKTTPCTNYDAMRYPNTPVYLFSPSVYGRSYFDLPSSMIFFNWDNPNNISDKNQQHIFNDLVTFKNTKQSGQEHPFEVMEHTIQQQDVNGNNQPTGLTKNTMVTFKKGYIEGQPLTFAEGSDPTSDDYFTDMQTRATATGRDLSSTIPCPATPNAFGKKEINICLKFVGNQVKRYNCKEYNDNFMGRVDGNIHPASAQSSAGNPYGFTQSTAGVFVPGSSGTVAEWISKGYDRYENERTDVINNTDSSVETFPADGVIFCNPANCDCNLRVKGIVDGQVNIVAKNVGIEGDIRHKDQSKDTDDMVGIVAKNEIIIPAGVPQAAGSASSRSYVQQQQVALADSEPPFTDTTPGGWPQNLAAAYQDITNFIPFDSAAGEFVDRNSTNVDYEQFVKWPLAQTGGKAYSSPTTLDIDAFMTGSIVKVDGIFNPKDDNTPSQTDNSGAYNVGLSVIVCTDPPACGNYSYRNPGLKSDTDPKALYKADGTLKPATTSGTVQPLFYVDGLNRTNMYIGQSFDEPTNGSYNDVSFQTGEEVSRPLNRGLSIFGGLNSKFFGIADSALNGANGSSFKQGFGRKLIAGDPRAKYMAPPGYPSTSFVIIDELYQKSHSGKSALIQ
jgi:hypothetical protein